NKATPTLSVTNSPVVYDGSPKSANVNGSVPGTASSILTGGAASQTAVGIYAVTANFAPTDSINYNSLTAASAGNFQISAATQTATVTNSPVTYNTSAQSAAVTCSGAGVVSNIRYNGSGTTPTNAATYAIVVDCAANGGFSATTNVAAGNFIINKATPTMSVTNSPVTYNGSAQAATVNGSVAGSVTSVQYNGSGTVPTNAATYAITANFAPTDSTNYNSLTAASAGNFIINKATPTLSVTNSPVVYDGSPKSANVNGSVPGTASSILTGGAASQTAVGIYPVTANFAPTDSVNYNSLTAASAGNFQISAATQTATVTNSPVTDNGSAQTAAVTCSGAGVVSNIRYNGSGTTPTNAATYAIVVDCAANGGFSATTNVAAGNFIINKATPTMSVTNSPVTYNGSAQAATVNGSV